MAEEYTLFERVDEFFEEHRFVAAILGIAAAVGILVVVAAAGNAVQIFSPRYGKRRFTYANKDWKGTFGYMERKGYLTKQKGGSDREYKYTLTELGFKRFLGSYIAPIKPRRIKWDGKWRVVMFDVREDKRRLRDLIRNQLRSLNFYQLQKSVWVSPHPLHDSFLRMLREGARLESIDLHYLHVLRFQGDERLVRLFNL